MLVRQTQAYKEAHSKSLRAAYSDPELRKRISELAKQRWQDLAFRARALATMQSEENRKKISAFLKGLWANPSYREATLMARKEKRSEP